MAKQKPIITKNAPGSIKPPVASLVQGTFNSTVDSQGYRIWHDRAVKCPCKSKGGDSFLSSCKNCGGTGWVFINRTETKAIIYSMEWKNAYKEWSEENLGNVYISIKDSDKLSFMDRVTVLDAETLHKQILYPYEYKGTLVASTIYNIKKIEEIFVFIDSDTPLQLLEPGVDYFIGSTDEELYPCEGIDDNFIRFSTEWKNFAKQKQAQNKPFQISISYEHAPQYHIIHLTREAMVSVQFDKSNKDMPINAVGRRSHYVLDRENFNGDRLFDNSYNPDKVFC